MVPGECIIQWATTGLSHAGMHVASTVSGLLQKSVRVGGLWVGIKSIARWAAGCTLGYSTKHFLIAVLLENVNGFSDCLNMEMQAFK